MNDQLQPYGHAQPARINPEPSMAINAASDGEAFSIWLRAKGLRSRHTHDSYHREAKRLLLWLQETRLKASTMTVDDVHRFFSHLGSPPEHWIRPRRARKDQELLPTQVMVGGLSAKSIAYSRTVLGELFSWLQNAGYIPHNPFKLSARPPVIFQAEQQRFLDLRSWDWLSNWIEAMPAKRPVDRAKAVRIRWLMNLLYHTGIRLAECTYGVMGDFVRRDDGWVLRVVGKGLKERYIFCNSVVMEELGFYRASLGLAETPSPGETMPLVLRIRSRGEAADSDIPLMSSRSIGLIIEGISREAALDCDDDHIRAQIEAMSTHWMRHTCATHRLMAGASLLTTQDDLGHADPRTTRIYGKTIDVERRKDAEKLAKLGRSRGKS